MQFCRLCEVDLSDFCCAKVDSVSAVVLEWTDLEWLVLPPLFANQALTMRGKVKDKGGLTVPLGLALWAKVCEDVDAKLKEQKAAGAPVRLSPRDWTSGSIPWLVLCVGPTELKSKLTEKAMATLGDAVQVFA